jgi:hypothetical protein
MKDVHKKTKKNLSSFLPKSVVIPEVVVGNPFFLRELGYPPLRV